MKEIVEILHENRQVELAKEILESAGYEVKEKSEEIEEAAHKMDIHVGDTLDVTDSHGEEYETTIKDIYITDIYFEDQGIFIKHSWVSKKDGRKGTSTHALSVFKRDILGIK